MGTSSTSEPLCVYEIELVIKIKCEGKRTEQIIKYYASLIKVDHLTSQARWSNKYPFVWISHLWISVFLKSAHEPFSLD